MVKYLPSDGSYEIVADNFFTSLKLVIKLTNLGHNYYGTVRKDRKGFSSITWKALENQGDYQHRTLDQNSAITGYSWKDSKTWYFLSNQHKPESIGFYIKRKTL